MKITLGARGDVVPNGPRAGLLYCEHWETVTGDTHVTVYRDATEYHAFYVSIFSVDSWPFGAFDDPCTYREIQLAVSATAARLHCTLRPAWR